MKTIANDMAQAMVTNNNAVIVDVREPVEFRETHLSRAMNFPSTKFQLETYQPFRNKEIYLIC